MRRDVFDHDMWCDILDVVGRLLIGSFGVIWFAISTLNIELGMRELSFSSREWVLFAQSIAGLLLVALSCLPLSLFNIRSVMWGIIPIIVFVEIGLAMIAYRLLHQLYLIHRFGVGIAPEPASIKMTKLAIAGASAVVLGVALALCVARLLRRSKQRQPH